MKYYISNSTDSLKDAVLEFNYSYDSEIETYRRDVEFFFEGLRRFFYLVTPEEAMFEKVEDVPNYFANAWPYFVLFICIENFLLWVQRKPTIRFNDGGTSMSLGLAHECSKLIFNVIESFCYISIYDKFRFFDLTCSNSISWYVAALAMDFFYYWGHRASHEVHILWAQHQVHHSSEDFNTVIGLRQSMLQGLNFIFYLPMAFFVSPPLFITHRYFNLLYQFWIHTEAVKTLGPLELIFNTPQHHRVHHGSNIWCLDKNYGGVLIIWDRIFGTFASENENEDIIYGLVVNKPSFNPFELQTFYTMYVLQKFSEMNSWKYKASALFFGPSWYPGSPRLGKEEDKLKVGPREKYDVKIPIWCNIYVLAHFIVLLFGYHTMMSHYLQISHIPILLFVIYILFSITSIGMLFDNNRYASISEVFRCMLVVTAIQNYDILLLDQNVLLMMEVFHLSSALFWFITSVYSLNILSLRELDKAN